MERTGETNGVENTEVDATSVENYIRQQQGAEPFDGYTRNGVSTPLPSNMPDPEALLNEVGLP